MASLFSIICSGETDQNGAFMGEIHFDVANLFIVHRDIPIMLHDVEDGPTKHVFGLTHVNFTMLM
jgi:hypothetical protein